MRYALPCFLCVMLYAVRLVRGCLLRVALCVFILFLLFFSCVGLHVILQGVFDKGDVLPCVLLLLCFLLGVCGSTHTTPLSFRKVR